MRTRNLTLSSPDVVVSTEDHAAFRVARRADLAQLGLAAGTLEASAVPVAVHGVKEEAVGDLAPAACTPLPGQGPRADRRWLAAASGIHHRTWEHRRNHVGSLLRLLRTVCVYTHNYQLAYLSLLISYQLFEHIVVSA